MESISLREYARRRGVSDTAVRKAITAGKIVNGRIYENGVPRIIESVANSEWDQYEQRPKERPTNPQPAAKPAKPVPHTQAPAAAAFVEPVKPPQTGTLAAERLVQAKLKNQLMATELKEKLGKLVEKDKVYASLFSAGKELRTNLLAIPDRHIDNILSAESRNEAHTVLYNALADVLEQIAELGKMNIAK